MEPDYFGQWLNMLCGGHWADRKAFRDCVATHVTGLRQLDPKQWRGWPKLTFSSEGYYFDGVW